MSSQYVRHEILTSLAYQSWLDRGQPIGSPEIDWTIAEQKLAAQEALDAAFAKAQLPEYSFAQEEADIPSLSALPPGDDPGKEFLGRVATRI
jgi:hypothetical protein